MDVSVARQKIYAAKGFRGLQLKFVPCSIDFAKSIWLLDCLLFFCGDYQFRLVVQRLFGIQSLSI